MVGSFYDPELDEGCAFEELICFHGGIGGLQTRPFILHPAHLEVPPRADRRRRRACTASSTGWRKLLQGGGASATEAQPVQPAAGGSSVTVSVAATGTVPER